MKLISYKKALTMGKDALDKVLIPVKVRKVKMQAELEMLKIEEQIATKQSELETMCYESEINFNGILSKMNEIGLLERKQEQFGMIIKQMFTDEPEPVADVKDTCDTCG